MEATLIVNGRDIKVQISQEEYKKLTNANKTGYERVGHNETFYIVDGDGDVKKWIELDYECDKAVYEEANYYTDRNLAVANARADKLMRNLRRFSVEHRTADVGWGNKCRSKWSIKCDYDNELIWAFDVRSGRNFGTVYFETKETAEAAIKKFKDELLWYFTKYKDSL